MGKTVQKEKKVKKHFFLCYNLIIFIWGMLSLHSSWMHNAQGETCKIVNQKTWYTIKTVDGEPCVLTNSFWNDILIVLLVWAVLVTLFFVVKLLRHWWRQKTI